MERFDLLIKNGNIVTSEGINQKNLLISDGKIVKVFNGELENSLVDRVIDASNLHVFPGLIDTHVHFNEPGRDNWEGLATGSRSLAAGGFTSFVDMPLNSTPPTINRENLNLKRSLAEQKSVVNAYFWGGLVPENIANLQELHEDGVLAFKAFASPSGIEDFNHVDDETIFKGMTEIARLGSFLGVHAESTVICNNLAEMKIAEGKTSARDFVESRPIISEIEAVRRLISYAEATGCKLHIVHASSRKVIKEISDAKNRGVDITVETCPHYLSLTIEDLESKGGLAKCCPPLREKEEVEDLWYALKHGEIDVIASDHSPAPADMKEIPNGNFFKGWGGISGAQSTLNVMLTEGYHKRGVALEKIVDLLATNPAKLFGLYPKKGTLTIGSDADITLVNLNEEFTLEKEDLHYKHKHSPYLGKQFKGAVKVTIVNGKVIFEENKILA